MILSYGNNEDSFSCESDSSCTSNISLDSLSRSSIKKRTKTQKETKDDSENMICLDTSQKKKRKSLETLEDEFANLKVSQKKKYENSNDISMDLNHNKGDKFFFSNDTLSLLNASRHKGFVDSDLDISNISFLHNPPKIKNPPKRCHSASSFQNLIDNFEDEEVHCVNCKKEEGGKKAPYKKGKENLNSSDIYANIHDLLKSDEKLSLNISSLSTSNINNNHNQINSNDISMNSKKKENFIPKSEILANSKGDNKSMSNINVNPILNYYDLSPKKSLVMKPIDEVPEHLKSSSNSKDSSRHNMNNSNPSTQSIAQSQGYVKQDTSQNNKHNISNSTDELFAHLNKKIDNFDMTNMTQSSFIKYECNHQMTNYNYNNIFNPQENYEARNQPPFFTAYPVNSNNSQNSTTPSSRTPNSNIILNNNDTGLTNTNMNINSNTLIPSHFSIKIDKNMKNSIIGNFSKVGGSNNINRGLIPQQQQQNTTNNNNYSDLSDEELAKIAEIISRDQTGCRFLQKKIIDDPSFANDILFYELQPSMMDLINDAFGNYLIQKMIENLDEGKIDWMIDLVSQYFLDVACSPHGTRVIQKIIENLRTEDLLIKFNYIFAKYAIPLAKDVNANHIVQKYLYTIRSPHNQFLYDIMISNLVEISTDKHGCCVMQKVVDAADPNQRSYLIEIILKHTMGFISDQYANYVIQFIIGLNDYHTNKCISEIFITNLRYLSKQKFSSNVIEKCFDHSNEEIQEFIVSEMVKDDTLISELIVDMYGNYVLQKALAVAKGENYLKFLRGVGSNLDKLKTVPFGNKLLAKFLNTYKELPSLIKNSNRGNKVGVGISSGLPTNISTSMNLNNMSNNIGVNKNINFNNNPSFMKQRGNNIIDMNNFNKNKVFNKNTGGSNKAMSSNFEQQVTYMQGNIQGTMQNNMNMNINMSMSNPPYYMNYNPQMTNMNMPMNTMSPVNNINPMTPINPMMTTNLGQYQFQQYPTYQNLPPNSTFYPNNQMMMPNPNLQVYSQLPPQNFQNYQYQ